MPLEPCLHGSGGVGAGMNDNRRIIVLVKWDGLCVAGCVSCMYEGGAVDKVLEMWYVGQY